MKCFLSENSSEYISVFIHIKLVFVNFLLEVNYTLWKKNDRWFDQASNYFLLIIGLYYSHLIYNFGKEMIVKMQIVGA